ncbi:hypothetical protein GGS21DRAFT_488025 [Xylaria nigripes]|nr:hypothetical protein GGS21DRAFT_488025 [Xylaria nigripes]
MTAQIDVTTLIIVSWVLGGIVIVITIARVIGRTLFLKLTGWDDFFMVLGSLSAIACSVLITVGTHHGLGKHEADIADPADRSDAVKYSILASAVHFLSSTSSKISILIFLVRLIGMSAKRWHIVFLWALGITLTSLNILAAVVTVCFCDPPQKQWEPSLPGTCLPPYIQLYIGFIQGAYSALTDIVVAVSPALFITQLNITPKMKLGLSLLMGGGIFAAGAAIAKTYYIMDGARRADITYNWTVTSLWYTAEMDVLIITGTIPTLWPLVRLIRRRGNKSISHACAYNRVRTYSSSHEASKPVGATTRALEEVDNMRTYGTWDGEQV